MADGRHLRLDPDAHEVTFTNDKVLLGRVLGNLLKNGLEASVPGQTVTTGCRTTADEIEFWVHNPACMPRNVQLQIFQRSFSTKGAGRGLGTYSIKLLTEKYLQGAASFVSLPDEGTTFFVRYPLHLTIAS